MTDDHDGGRMSNSLPLPDVQPGEIYEEECFPAYAIRIHEILVAKGFELFSLTTHQHGCVSPGKPVDVVFGQYLYKYDGIPVRRTESVRLALRNKSDRPLKVKVPSIIPITESRKPA